jgi:hypothetical protein
MNLAQIRTKFIQENGRYDLVVDTTNYADNGADFFIQSGQRLLDSILPNRKTLGNYVKNIVLNQSSLVIKRVRFIDTVYYAGAGVDRNYLTRKSYSWLVEEYGEDFGEKAKGTGEVSVNPSEDETITIGGETYTFKDTVVDDTDIEIETSVTDTISNIITVIN